MRQLSMPFRCCRWDRFMYLPLLEKLSQHLAACNLECPFKLERCFAEVRHQPVCTVLRADNWGHARKDYDGTEQEFGDDGPMSVRAPYGI